MKCDQKKVEYLKGYEDSKRQQKRLISELQSVRDDIQLINYVFNGSYMSNERKLFFSKSIKRIKQMEPQILQMIEERSNKMQSIITSINSLDDQTEKDLLQHRYIELMQWDQISDCMIYSLKQIHRIHQRSLEHLQIGE